MKTFTHTPVELKSDLVKVPAGRFHRYQKADGTRYPSITKCLSILSRDAIAAWRQRVGAEEANRISKKATTRGTRIHSICEDYINNKEVDIKKESMIDQQMFNAIQPIMDDHIDNIYLQEKMLYSDHLGVVGKPDLIAEWDGKMTSIDFKTSLKEKREEWVQNYFQQAAAYCVMFEERTGIPVPNIAVLISVENDNPQVFLKKRNAYIGDCIKTIQQYMSEQNA